MIKGTHKRIKLTSYYNGKRLNAFPLRPGTTPESLFSPLLLSIVPEVPSSATSQGRGKKKDILNGKEEMSLCS